MNMRKVAGIPCVAFVIVAASTEARCDQGPPVKIEVMFRHATTIVDATVREITTKGAAKIDVHKVIRGPKKPTTMIVGSPNDTAGLTPASRDLKKGNRYLLLLRGNQLANYGFRQLHAFKIRKTSAGKLECQLRHDLPNPANRFDAKRIVEWLPLKDVEARISRAVSKKRKK